MYKINLENNFSKQSNSNISKSARHTTPIQGIYTSANCCFSMFNLLKKVIQKNHAQLKNIFISLLKANKNTSIVEIHPEDIYYPTYICDFYTTKIKISGQSSKYKNKPGNSSSHFLAFTHTFRSSNLFYPQLLPDTKNRLRVDTVQFTNRRNSCLIPKRQSI